jgi:hypothetical protein
MFLHLADRVIANAEGTPPRIATTVIGAGYFEALGLTMPVAGSSRLQTAPRSRSRDRESAICRAMLGPARIPLDKDSARASPWSTVVGVSQPFVKRVFVLTWTPWSTSRSAPPFWFSIMARVRSLRRQRTC